MPNFNEHRGVVGAGLTTARVNKQHINNIHPSMSANWRTNQMYTLGITNVFGMAAEFVLQRIPAAWPWMCNPTDRPVGSRHHQQGRAGVAVLITNLVSRPYRNFTTLKSNWMGGEFTVPLRAAITTVTNSIYSTAWKRFVLQPAFTNVFESGFTCRTGNCTSRTVFNTFCSISTSTAWSIL